MASTEKGIHMPFMAANCTVMWRRIERRIRSGPASSMVAPIVFQVDHGGNALFVRPDAEPLAQSDRPIHDSAGPAIDSAMGRVCGIRGRLSGTRRDTPVCSIRNCAET